MSPRFYFAWNYGISINEGEFPNLVISWRSRLFYSAFSWRWKFIFGAGNFRIGPWEWSPKRKTW